MPKNNVPRPQGDPHLKVSRSEAKALGLTHYFTGNPCKNGHVSLRSVKWKKCLDCDAERHRQARIDNPNLAKETRRRLLERDPDYERRWRRNNAEACREAARRWGRRYPERLRESQRKTDSNPIRKAKKAARQAEKYADNPEHIRAINRAWGRRNTAKKIALNAKRHAAKLQRTPAWADHDAIKFFYECRPKGCHVDHIIPLQAERISGLHVETNLQWLPASWNMSKRNSFLQQSDAR